MEHLRVALFDYAREHDGKFPAHDFVHGIPEKMWESPDESGSHYVYSGGLGTNTPTALLAIEPPNFGENRFVLMTSGEIQLLSKQQIEEKLVAQGGR